MAGLRELCQAVDSYDKDQQFTQQDIVELASVSRAMVTSYFPGLVKMGDLQRYKSKPFKYSRTIDMTAKFEAGEYHGFFTAIRAGRLPEAPDPIDEEFEVDPLEVFEQMEPDDFGHLVSMFVSKKRAALEPLVAQVASLKQELELQESRALVHSNTLEGTIRQLREELKTERATIMGLRDDLFKERERHAHTDHAQVRTVYIKEKPSGDRAQGGSLGGGGFSRVKMHKKPHTGHPSKVVVEHRKHR